MIQGKRRRVRRDKWSLASLRARARMEQEHMATKHIRLPAETMRQAFAVAARLAKAVEANVNPNDVLREALRQGLERLERMSSTRLLEVLAPRQAPGETAAAAWRRTRLSAMAKLPYGWARDKEGSIVEVPHEQEAIQVARRLRDLGRSYAHIGEELTRMGLKPRGSCWHKMTVRALVSPPPLLGEPRSPKKDRPASGFAPLRPRGSSRGDGARRELAPPALDLEAELGPLPPVEPFPAIDPSDPFARRPGESMPDYTRRVLGGC